MNIKIDEMKSKLETSVHRRNIKFLKLNKDYVNLPLGTFDIIFDGKETEYKTSKLNDVKEINEFIYLSYHFLPEDHFSIFDVSFMKIIERDEEYIIAVLLEKHTTEQFKELLVRYYKN